jgi:ribonuclease HIII
MSEIEKAIQEYKEYKELLLNKDFKVPAYKVINYGLQFQIEKSGWTGMIRIYQNKQGKVKTDFSQLDSSDLSELVKKICSNQNEPNTKTLEVVNLSDLELPIMGSDESGKGDYFGPLVCACVYVDKEISIQLSALGVRDSKTLSDQKNSDIARQIERICLDKFVVIEISPEKYNQIYTDLRKQNKSLNDLLAWAHAKSIEELLSKVECTRAVVDKFANEKILLKNLKEKGKKIEIIQVPKAESYVAVAAASVLARDRFVKKLEKIGSLYNKKLPKGASKNVIAVAEQLVSEHGSQILDKIAKIHFKTTDEISV